MAPGRRAGREDNRPCVFCDFDGTITDTETLVGLMQALIPEETAAVTEKMMSRELSVKEGVRHLVHAIPSSRFHEIRQHSESLSIRPGFVAFLDFLEKHAIPFVLVSGGLGIMVRTVLKGFVERFHGFHALELDTTGDFLRLKMEYEGQRELMAKARVMENYAFGESVAIGDGYTDRNMALAADRVFARGNLARFLEKKGRDYFSWNDFFDIRDSLSRAWSLDP